MNRIIWTYWHQGFEQANDIIHQCVKSWRYYNPGWEIILLDENSVKQYITPLDIPEDIVHKLKVQHRSDLIRTKLLINYGGVWADPTCFCVKPLDDWLSQCMKSGVFFFSNPGRDRVIANWFIAANQPDNPWLIKIYTELCNYWSINNFRNFHKEYPQIMEFLEKFFCRTPKVVHLWLNQAFLKIIRLYPYMIYHYMAYYQVLKNKEIRKIWMDMPKILADKPHKLQHLKLTSSITNKASKLIDDKSVPVFKLYWKLNLEDIKEGTIIEYLFNSIR